MDEYDDAKKAYVKELVDGHSRKEIDEMAKALDLDPEKYATKREVALGIMLATDQASMYEPEGNIAEIEEECEEVDVTMSSVKSIRNATKDKATNFMTFYKGEFLTNIAAFHGATQVFRDDIMGQRKENRDFANVGFAQSVKKYQQSIEAFRRSILEQSKETQKYIKQFYG